MLKRAAESDAEKIEGLIGKSFIGNTDTGVYGGPYQFSSKEVGEKYITSEIRLGIEEDLNLENFTNEIDGVPHSSHESKGILAKRETSRRPEEAETMQLLATRCIL